MTQKTTVSDSVCSIWPVLPPFRRKTLGRSRIKYLYETVRKTGNETSPFPSLRWLDRIFSQMKRKGPIFYSLGKNVWWPPPPNQKKMCWLPMSEPAGASSNSSSSWHSFTDIYCMYYLLAEVKTKRCSHPQSQYIAILRYGNPNIDTTFGLYYVVLQYYIVLKYSSIRPYMHYKLGSQKTYYPTFFYTILV